ncbi:hypothetical protein B0J14DRAFT_583468 [Halenospora varia]|nr:hypothetical protein B0J14DRAFT_583468 [Halenospora varia]
MASLVSINITVPNGTTTHGNPHLICPPATWVNIFVFFLGNYFAHAGTVTTRPGASMMEGVSVIVLALLFPATGLYRGCTMIYNAISCDSLPKFTRWIFHLRDIEEENSIQKELRTAARAGALCTLRRTKRWLPRSWPRNTDASRIIGCTIIERLESALESPLGPMLPDDLSLDHLGATVEEEARTDETSNQDDSGTHSSRPSAVNFTGSHEPALCNIEVYTPRCLLPSQDLSPNAGRIVSNDLSIHGRVALPRSNDLEYELVVLPPNAIVDAEIPIMSNTSASRVTISSSHSFAKAAIAILQLIFSTMTLVRASEGEQLEFYGYSAFSLTVAPYFVMSLVNLVANIFCPQYPAIYMVRNSVMDEAEERYGRTFEGVIGRLRETSSVDYWGRWLGLHEKNDAKLQGLRRTRSQFQQYEARLRQEHNRVDIRGVFLVYAAAFMQSVQGIAAKNLNWPPASQLRETILTSDNCVTWEVIPNATKPKLQTVAQSASLFLANNGMETMLGNIGHAPSSSVDDRYAMELPLLTVPSCGEFATLDGTLMDTPRVKNLTKGLATTAFATLLGSPFLIIYLISNLRRGTRSTHAQRVWISTWLCFGQAFFSMGMLVLEGFELLAKNGINHENGRIHGIARYVFGFVPLIFGIFFYAAPAIGGFVVVGQMLLEYGNCAYSRVLGI